MPEISADGSDACPIDCQRFKRGSVIAFHYQFSDNVELGGYNIEVHNNFDHHTHSTSAAECEIESEKKPVNPFRKGSKPTRQPSTSTFLLTSTQAITTLWSA